MKTTTITALSLALATMPCAHGQPYPSRPLRMVVPFAPGGPTDIVGRIVAQKLGERLGQTVVVDNRPGATGMVGTEMVVKAPPDGYTLLLCSTSALVTSPILLARQAYDARRDLAPITTVLSVPYLLLVKPDSGIGTVKEFIALAKAKPGSLNYGSAGTGSTSHLGPALFASMAGIDIVHIPYKGSSLAATDLIGGQLQFIFEAIAAGMQYVKSGRLRPLGVSTSKRVTSLPDLPTISEAGLPGYEVSTWHGICAPAGTSPEIVARLNREIVAAIRVPDTRERLTGIGAELVGSTQEELRALIVAEIPRWQKLIRELDLKGH